MRTQKLLELWSPPSGMVLASALATTYECQADFLEEDLLPAALQLSAVPASGRAFRLELERALQQVEVTIFLHPQRYQRGKRRSPRIDLIPLHEGRHPKLHAKVTLLRFVNPLNPQPELQMVRLVIGSANLTNGGYRSNVEVAVALDDTTGAHPEVVTAVRDAVAWMGNILGTSTSEQANRQLRDMRAVFLARTHQPRRERLRFVGLPTKGGLLSNLQPEADDKTKRLTLISPFWPSGDEPMDVVAALKGSCGGTPKTVRLLGNAEIDAEGVVRPELPSAFVAAWMSTGASVAISASQPGFGCEPGSEQPAGEFDSLANSRITSVAAHRGLHAKMLLFEGKKTVRLAAGSFNLTRRGLGSIRTANLEAGLVWTLPNKNAGALLALSDLALGWVTVDSKPEELVIEPKAYSGASGGSWPKWLYAIRARSLNIEIEGSIKDFPSRLQIRMRDVRGRLVNEERWFDSWVVTPPQSGADGRFTATLPMTASWQGEAEATAGRWKMLPDLEVELAWDDHLVVVPVLFVDKHNFPVVEGVRRLGERALIDWFLGLRPKDETDGDGFGHSLDPLSSEAGGDKTQTSDLLSYLVRDFVHALPGIATQLEEAGLTETGLRTALFGPRSPVALANESVLAWQNKGGQPKKSAVATTFQLVELLEVLQSVRLQQLPESMSETLRSEAIEQITALLTDVSETAGTNATTTLTAYLNGRTGAPNASA